MSKYKILTLFALAAVSAAAVYLITSSQLPARAYTAAVNSTPISRSSCCSVSPPAEQGNALADEALELYIAGFGSSPGLQAEVEDYGCHQEIVISENGQFLKRYGYNGGTFYDLSP